MEDGRDWAAGVQQALDRASVTGANVKEFYKMCFLRGEEDPLKNFPLSHGQIRTNPKGHKLRANLKKLNLDSYGY